MDVAPIRIVRILTRLNIGGPARQAILLSTRLDPERFSTCLVAGRLDEGEGDLSDMVQPASSRFIRLTALRRAVRPWSDVVALDGLVRIMWRERPAILHTHMAKAGTLGRLAGLLYNRLGPGRRREARAVLIHTFHGHVLDGYFTPWVAGVFLTIERWLARRTDVLIAVSPAIRDALLRKRIGRPEQWRVIPLGLDLSDLAQASLPDGASPLAIGLVGRLVPIKHPGLFLEALARLTRGPHASVAGVIVGDGPLRKELERQAVRLGIQPPVRFDGWQRDLPAVYRGLGIVCLTSWNEGTPVALIEAMAAGRPVVATDVGGVRDLLEGASASRVPIPPGEFRIAPRGVLVSAGDADGLAAALGTMAADADLRRTLATAARSYAVEQFGAERLAHDLSTLYDTCARRTREAAVSAMAPDKAAPVSV